MKKTLIISTLALSVSSFASASVFDIMNLSAEQTEAVEQVRENKKLEDAERKRVPRYDPARELALFRCLSIYRTAVHGSETDDLYRTSEKRAVRTEKSI